MDGYLIFFIIWLISNIAALPLFFNMTMDGSSNFFIPIEIYSRLRQHVSKPLSILFSCLFCVWFSFIILLNIIIIITIMLTLVLLFSIWSIERKVFERNIKK